MVCKWEGSYSLLNKIILILPKKIINRHINKYFLPISAKFIKTVLYAIFCRLLLKIFKICELLGRKRL